MKSISKKKKNLNRFKQHYFKGGNRMSLIQLEELLNYMILWRNILFNGLLIFILASVIVGIIIGIIVKIFMPAKKEKL